jgi:SRSO17 transposase
MRCWRMTSDRAAACGLGERTTRGQPEERQYSWSNLPAPATLEELAGYAHRRYAVEQLHAEAEGELGWDQYQGRLWPGFHRHATTVNGGLRYCSTRRLCRQGARRAAGGHLGHRPPECETIRCGTRAFLESSVLSLLTR